MRRVRRLALLAMLAAAGGVACEEGLGPQPSEEGVPESALTFLRFPEDLQPLVSRSGSFWAVKGESRELVLSYIPEEPDEEGEEFLEFRVPAEALLRRPDGTLFEPGDSIEITVEVAEDGRFLFDFQPSGLTFDPEHAPRLRVTYELIEGDLDGDGDLDDDDAELEEDLGLWRQESPGELWFPIGVIKFDDLDEIDGEIFGFTGFAIAG